MTTPFVMEKNAIKIQKWYRGTSHRLKNLPFILYRIKTYLQRILYQYIYYSSDRKIVFINDNEVISLLKNRFNNKIIIPTCKTWYNFVVYDNLFGWLPIDLKTVDINEVEEFNNLTMCFYSYTDIEIPLTDDFELDDEMTSELFIQKLKQREYSKKSKKDYYFIRINKNCVSDVIINSVKGLKHLISPLDVNVLPFGICWNENKTFQHENINKKVELFVDCLKKHKPSWEEIFLENMRQIEI